MDTLILIIKIINIFFISILMYIFILKRKMDYLNSLFCSLIIFLSLGCVFFINSLSYNIFIFLLLMITFLMIDNIPEKVEFEKSSVIIRDGKINILELVKNKYSLKKILNKIKYLNFKKISNIDLAMLDKDGKISFYIKLDNKNISFVLIISGRVNYDALKTINKDSFWLNNELSKRKILLDDVIYAFFNNNLLYIIKK